MTREQIAQEIARATDWSWEPRHLDEIDAALLTPEDHERFCGAGRPRLSVAWARAYFARIDQEQEVPIR